eukprot:746562-Hanusia_phi.AAC.4
MAPAVRAARAIFVSLCPLRLRIICSSSMFADRIFSRLSFVITRLRSAEHMRGEEKHSDSILAYMSSFRGPSLPVRSLWTWRCQAVRHRPRAFRLASNRQPDAHEQLSSPSKSDRTGLVTAGNHQSGVFGPGRMIQFKQVHAAVRRTRPSTHLSL